LAQAIICASSANFSHSIAQRNAYLGAQPAYFFAHIRTVAHKIIEGLTHHGEILHHPQAIAFHPLA
jgi:hypothetical protein